MSCRRKTRIRRHDRRRPSGDGARSHAPLGAIEPRHDRKSLQLCRQVAEALAQVLSGECDDDVLRGLQVLGVTPAPDASQLLVLVAPALAGETLDPVEVVARLDRRAGRLRSEVAASITRRRAPRLMYQFLPQVPAARPDGA